MLEAVEGGFVVELRGLPSEVRETHVGVVFLVGDRAYKMKKPVTTGFLDFGTPERRLAARSEERRVGKECRSRWSPYH